MSLRVAAALMAGLALAAIATAQDVLVLRAGRWVAPDGSLQYKGELVIRDGRIAAVGGEAPPGARVVEFANGVLSPGMIDVQSSLGAEGQLDEPADPIQPHARAAEALNRHRRELERAMAAGVTALGLAPGDGNLVAGRLAVCHTHGDPLTDGPMKLSLAPQVYRGDREPTGRSGAVDLLRRSLQAAAGAASDEPLQGLLPLVNGEIGGLLVTPASADVSAALRLQSEFKLRLAFVHDLEAARVAPDLKSAGASVVVGPYDLQTAPRRAAAAGIFDAAGVPVAIAGGLPGRSADGLRVAAAVAVRHGLSPAAARRAVTAVPAEILGMAGEIGALEKGRRADVVVYSGDPLDLRSSVLSVFIDGARWTIETGHE